MSGTNPSGRFNGYQAGPTPIPAATVFLAAANANPGAPMYNYTIAQIATGGLTPSPDWLSPIVSWPVPASTIAILSQTGKIALTVASLASLLSPSFGSTQTTIGTASFAINDVASRAVDVYAYYGEARIDGGGVQGTAFGAEFDAINFGSAVGPSTPYHQLFSGGAVALWMASGGGLGGVNDALACLAVVNNGAKFRTGISFGATAITGTDGVTGFGTAIALAKGHLLQWYATGGSDGIATASITSTITAAANAVSLQFQNGALLLLGPQGQTNFAISTVTNAVNSLGVTPALAGAAPSLVAFGADTNVSLSLNIKGTAPVLIGAGVSAPTNLIWLNTAGNQVAAIVPSVTAGINFTSLNFGDAGSFFSFGAGGSAKTMFSVGNIANAANYLAANAAATGSAPGLTAQGTDANVDIALTPQGTGTLRLLVPSQVTAGALVGYATIVINGTARSVPYYATS